MDDRFTADDINDLLHFLYTNDLTSRQKSDPLATFMVADYFQAKALREDSVVALRSGLTLLVETAYWRNFRKCESILSRETRHSLPFIGKQG